jgi:signal transduction histidine kinase
MPEGGIITVKCENLANGPEDMPPGVKCIRISITDQGSGISPDIKEKIFDPYFSTKEGKSGLGLATSYSIISKHGGLLTAESNGRDGTEFSIYLPAEELNLPSKGVERKELTVERRVLVMDDEDEVREVAEGILRSIGCETTQA